MKYIFLGNISSEWATRHSERIERAKAKFQDLGIKLETVYYTQGPFDFVDIIDAPNPEAALAFSLWYANQGLGRIQTMPAFDSETLGRAAEKARS
jgi:uncharacterized protein with GYD domain